MSGILKNRSILFIAPSFFNIESFIVNELEAMDARVQYIPERPYGFMFRFTNSINKGLFNRLCNHYLNKILKTIRKDFYDDIFIIRGQILTVAFMHTLKQMNPKARTIMYQWDSLRLNSYEHLIPFFDKVFSFDMVDCIYKPMIEYLPLFYTKDYELIRSEPDRKEEVEYALITICWIYEERYKTIKQIERICKENSLKFYAYMYMPLSSFVKALLKGKFYWNVQFRIISRRNIIELYKKSRSVLDIPHGNQDGLTIRTFEVLGAGKKLITTNKNIKKEPFYSEDNILILEEDYKQLIPFLRNIKKQSSSINTMEMYSLNNWLKRIFHLTEVN